MELLLTDSSLLIRYQGGSGYLCILVRDWIEIHAGIIILAL